MMPSLDVQPLRTTFHGDLFTPETSGYDAACRIWNASVNKRPALVARCSGLADIIAAVNFARGNGLLTAVRGGGHNVGGRALCDDGIVIDLSQMRAVHVDPAQRTVRVQGGATLGDLDRETHAFVPSELDLTPEAILHIAPFEFHVAYETDMPVDRLMPSRTCRSGNGSRRA